MSVASSGDLEEGRSDGFLAFDMKGDSRFGSMVSHIKRRHRFASLGETESIVPIGIIAGLTTCALWGLTFVAPRAVAPFTAWDLTVARYGIFGAACLVAMVDRRFRPRGIPPRRLLIGLMLGGAGYVGYFVSAASAVQLAGPAIPPVVIGVMPVFLAIVANLRDRSAPWRVLAIPLTLIGAGVGIVSIAALCKAGPADVPSIALGIVASATALMIWMAYGLANAAVMRSADAPDGLRWTGVQGIGAAISSLMLLPLTSLGTSSAASLSDALRFGAWALTMGLAGSWFATWCWVVASHRLPLALAAQLIVAETVFGLAYGFLFERRWPTGPEAVGAGLQVAGVCAAIAAFDRSVLTPKPSRKPVAERSHRAMDFANGTPLEASREGLRPPDPER